MSESEIDDNSLLMQSLQGTLQEIEETYSIQAGAEIEELHELLRMIVEAEAAGEETDNLVNDFQSLADNIFESYTSDEDIALQYAESEVNDAVARLQYYPNHAQDYQELSAALQLLFTPEIPISGREFYETLQQINARALEIDEEVQSVARVVFAEQQRQQRRAREEQVRQQRERDRLFEENQRRLNDEQIRKRARRGSPGAQ